MTGLGETLAKLMVRKQTLKIRTYLNLKRLILTCITVFAFIFLGIVVYQTGGALLSLFAYMVDLWNCVDNADNWQLAWFVNEGSLALLYFFLVISVMILWRPTSNNLRCVIRDMWLFPYFWLCYWMRFSAFVYNLPSFCYMSMSFIAALHCLYPLGFLPCWAMRCLCFRCRCYAFLFRFFLLLFSPLLLPSSPIVAVAYSLLLRYGLAFDETDIEFSDQVVSASAANERAKLRKQPAGREGLSEEDENLKWVEENVPVLEQIEDIQIMTCAPMIIILLYSFFTIGKMSKSRRVCCTMSGPSSTERENDIRNGTKKVALHK